ncbi:hypothetical protein LSAT2_005551 [Lamellibrachia satsuma]|nr:hypothetical protein LSAT2_005551 [Lamellibrachia satsuma]
MVSLWLLVLFASSLHASSLVLFHVLFVAPSLHASSLVLFHVLFASSLHASSLVRLAGMFQACTEVCDSDFSNCILDVHCPRMFPLPIPNEQHPFRKNAMHTGGSTRSKQVGGACVRSLGLKWVMLSHAPSGSVFPNSPMTFCRITKTTIS